MLDAHPGKGSEKTLPDHPLLSQLNHNGMQATVHQCKSLFVLYKLYSKLIWFPIHSNPTIGTTNYSPSPSHTPPSTNTSPPLQHNLPAPDASRKDPSWEDASREVPSEKDASRIGGEEPSSFSSGDPSVKRRGLSALVMKYLGKPLDKSQQLSDWEKRPLRVEQVKYAGMWNSTAINHMSGCLCLTV